MKTVIMALGACLLLAASAQAAEKRSYGEIVSDCNHAANAQKLQGRVRKDFVEWCNERALREDDARAGRYPGCHERADELDLEGDERRRFIGICVDRREMALESKANRALWQEYRSCFERADEHDIQGEDEVHEFVDWCVAHGDRYTDEQWARYLRCDARAEARGLSGERRREYLRDCLDDYRVYNRRD